VAYEVAGVRVEQVKQMNGSPLWAVRNAGNVLSIAGQWECEPMSSSRDDEFIARCRFPNAKAAIDAARARADEGAEG
jgi:hypothetical protein